MMRTIQSRAHQVVHSGIHDDKALAPLVLYEVHARQKNSGIAHNDSAGFENERQSQFPGGADDKLRIVQRRGCFFTVVGNAQTTTEIQVAEPNAFLPELRHKFSKTLDRLPVRAELCDLGTNVTRHAHDLDLGLLLQLEIELVSLLETNSKLMVPHPRRDIGVSTGIDVGICAQGDSSTFARLARCLYNQIRFSGRFHVEEEDIGLEPMADFVNGLARTIKYNLLAGTTGSQHSKQLPARYNLEAGTPRGKLANDTEVGVRLNGIAKQVRNLLKRITEDLHLTVHRRLAVNINRRADFAGNLVQRNAFTMQAPVDVVEKMHAPL